MLVLFVYYDLVECVGLNFCCCGKKSYYFDKFFCSYDKLYVLCVYSFYNFLGDFCCVGFFILFGKVFLWFVSCCVKLVYNI